MEQIKDFSEVVGLTIDKVIQSVHQEIVLRFSDGRYLYVKGVDYDGRDAEVYVDYPFQMEHACFSDDDLVDLGFLTREEAAKKRADRAEFERQQQEKYDRATYERLKARFEGQLDAA